MTFANSMQLRELLQDVVGAIDVDVAVSGLKLDSREVVAGDLFVALSGTREQGHQYVSAAIEAGTIAVLVDESVVGDLIDITVPCFAVPDLRQKLGLIAERFYGFPSRQMFVVGVTGTNGKTSCSHFIAQVLNTEAVPVALLGTLGNGLVGQLQSASHTTPDAISLHRMMREFVDAGAKCLVMEVSSHGLEQGRVAGVGFDLALFTNLTRDHLDYHGDMASYGRAKAGLFEMPGLRYAVINADDEFGRSLLLDLPAAVEHIAFTQTENHSEENVVRGQLISQGHDGLLLDVQTPWGDGRIHSELLGQFNASNLLAVLAVVLLSGMGIDTALQKISQLKTVPGRVERFGGVAGQPLVVVDYAHTPDALEQVLLSLRQHCAAQLWCVFGCGGERDKGKRPQMGGIAGQYADQIVLTDDNPRNENPDAIIEDIIVGLKSDRVTVLRDRAAAIRHAVTNATATDVILVAGKGHEDYQQIGEKKIPFSDSQQVQQALGVAA